MGIRQGSSPERGPERPGVYHLDHLRKARLTHGRGPGGPGGGAAGAGGCSAKSGVAGEAAIPVDLDRPGHAEIRPGGPAGFNPYAGVDPNPVQRGSDFRSRSRPDPDGQARIGPGGRHHPSELSTRPGRPGVLARTAIRRSGLRCGRAGASALRRSAVARRYFQGNSAEQRFREPAGFARRSIPAATGAAIDLVGQTDAHPGHRVERQLHAAGHGGRVSDHSSDRDFWHLVATAVVVSTARRGSESGSRLPHPGADLRQAAGPGGRGHRVRPRGVHQLRATGQANGDRRAARQRQTRPGSRFDPVSEGRRISSRVSGCPTHVHRDERRVLAGFDDLLDRRLQARAGGGDEAPMKHQTSFDARLALGALLFGLLVCGCRSQTNGKGTAKPPEDEVWLTPSEMNKAQVQLAKIEEREVDRSITAGGRIAFDDLRVTRVLAQPGERVKKGTPLLAILSPDIGTAVSDVVKAQADLAASERDFHRQQQLAAAHAGTQRELEAAEGAYRRAQAELARAKLKQQLLKSGDVDSVTQEFILRSPIEGRIVSRTVNPGMEVQGQYSGGTAIELFTIGELDQVWVLADVSDQDFPRVHKGAEVTVKVVAYPDRQFKGTVDWVSSTLDPTLRTAKVRCSLPNPDQALKIEMYATVEIGVEGKKAVAVPRDALVRINDQTVVYVAQGQSNEGWSVFKRRRVEVVDDGEQFLAVSGVSPGEQVVIQGAVSAAPANDEAWITPKQLEAASVKLAVAREQDLEMTVSVGGKVSFDDLRVTHVFSPVNGRVMKVFGNLCEKIAQGAPLVTIASPDVGSAFSDLLKAKSDLTSAEREYRRQQDLYAAHAGSQKDLETAEGNYRKAKAEHDRAQLKSTMLKSGSLDEVTQQYTLRSRIAGEIIARNVNPGAEVQGQYSGANNPIEMFTIGELDPIWVFADVYEMDLL